MSNKLTRAPRVNASVSLRGRFLERWICAWLRRGL